ncbi:putative LRR receptor-like serine/threonine-protein kinase [Dendrobium catenatum]|uniref:Receptor kinase-like protein Xa21 n=2 Tax=Dendrobium catenatum TaxID=906689 RepID=A0A2I0VJF6_9ASPA|nr:putative LRR receptor-like serine/threonine-protein kinase [Dendrobium catenatum]
MALTIWLRIYSSFLLILFFPQNFIISSVQSSGDAVALLSFKSHITYDPDGALASWGNSSLHFCNWLGVTCSNHSSNEARVSALELLGFDLAGFLSPSLGNLSFLYKLHISETRISGSIPHELGSLSNLRLLNLSHNSLVGEIPHTLSQCSLLQIISLKYNMLDGEIPSNLSLCTMLRFIDFNSNNLIGIIPASFGALKGLEVLLLHNNKLVAMKEGDWNFLTALTNCSNLKFLGLGKNSLTGLFPISVTNLSVHLKYLDLEENQIYGGFPFGIEKLVNLQELYLGINHFSGAIPPSIGEFLMLKIFDLSNNQFSGSIPPSFCNLSSLSGLNIGINNLQGGIPPCFGNLTSLTSLNLSQINLTGEIPSSLGHLLKLNVFSLRFNNLYGNIPPSLGSLRLLLMLDLGYNKLSGVIPDSLWNLTSLIDLGIENNNLIGVLPMKTLPSLKYLRLSDNNLHGPITASLFNSSKLELLQLFKNFFDGPIHTNIGNLKNLSNVLLGANNLQARNIKEWSFIVALTNCTNLNSLDLFSNELEGMLPQSIVNLTTTLAYFRLGWNKISGNIPIEIENLIGLNLLNLGPNNLWGTIPVGIEKLTSLQRLDLRGNGLSGEIPYNIGNLSMLDILYLDHNDLSGHIPSNLGSCKQLMQLYLQYNNFMGPIPKEILSITSLSLGIDLSNNLLTGLLSIDVGLLVNLEYLALSSNKLSGQIPSNLAQCVQLKYLYMDNNLFQGNIPSSLEALKSLELFNLSHNNLSGKIPKFLESLQNLDLSYNHLEGEVPKNGVFLNSSAFSVYGNDKLCGGIVELKLPPCLENNQVSRKNHTLTMLIATVILITCIILLFVLSIWRRRKSKKLPSIERLEKDHNHVQVSYAELRRATNGFSSHNLIGRGSFGSVYIGNLDHNWQKSIAIKVLNLQQRGASKSFELECKALRNVRHRNLVKILTSCSSINHEGNDFKALVFEYMSNGNLDKWLHQPSIFDNNRPKKLTIIQRINILIDVASAVDYLHNHGPIPIVHCDLKPSNVLLDEDMVAHVSDFGLARLLIDTTKQSSQTSTSSIALKGTIGYAAPEYGAANNISVEGDVYSFGIILLELFTGRRPIEETFNEGLTLHLFVKASLPERAMDIVDPYLLLQEEDDEVGEGLRRMKVVSKFELDCIISVLTVGLHCSEESPTERIQMAQAFNELNAIRNIFLKSSNDRTTHL